MQRLGSSATSIIPNAGHIGFDQKPLIESSFFFIPPDISGINPRHLKVSFFNDTCNMTIEHSHMIDLFEAVERIQQWMDDFLSVNNAAFGGLPPCPFAKKAWLDKKVAISNIYDESQIVEYWIDRTFDGTIEVGCIVLDPTAISADDLTAMCERLEAARTDFVFLDDHPDYPEIVAGQRLNQGDYALIFVQPRDHLERARAMLAKTPYYDHWTEEYKKDVLG